MTELSDGVDRHRYPNVVLEQSPPPKPTNVPRIFPFSVPCSPTDVDGNRFSAYLSTAGKKLTQSMTNAANIQTPNARKKDSIWLTAL